MRIKEKKHDLFFDRVCVWSPLCPNSVVADAAAAIASVEWWIGYSTLEFGLYSNLSYMLMLWPLAVVAVVADAAAAVAVVVVGVAAAVADVEIVLN